ncbi:alpha-aspartyl dipeptidase-like protein [Sarcoptes scabiei]|nr:alpha-aspartyl dipeptidase-like protein [Sarcoptes scabiei]
MSGQPYLQWPRNLINDFLKSFHVNKVVFIPFAAVRIDWDEYAAKVQNSLSNFEIASIHKFTDYKDAINEAEAIMIGGGNTFHLLYKLYEFNLIECIRNRLLGSNPIPYIGWSAGSNVAGPNIGTTNDMPIIWPPSDQSLNVIPYNINPHFNEWNPPNFQGETRIDRLNEFVEVRKSPIVAFSEGVAIRIQDGHHKTIAPQLENDCFVDKIDNRCIKLWTWKDNQANIENIEIGSDLKNFIENQ